MSTDYSIIDIMKDFIKGTHIDVVPIEIKNKRIETCRMCSHIKESWFGEVCGISGCLLTAKAELAKSRCSDSNNPRWEAIA